MPCDLPYIPERLHQNGRVSIPSFNVGEFVYRRARPNELENPFAKISLTDISVNRSGRNQELSIPDDVLFSIRNEEDFEVYTDLEICTLQIKDLNRENQYAKQFSDDEDLLTIKLLHDPVECMYAHSVFEIALNNEIVTFDNYANTLKAKRHRKLRSQVRQELATMIIQRTISQGDLTDE